MLKNPKDKGSEFERYVGRKLSIWLTNGARANLFSRNVLSGGGFTVTAAKGIETPNIPGDLMAASPLAFEFLSLFSIECKHRADIDLDVFVRDRKGTSFLSKTIQHTKTQANSHGLTYMVIAKQNRHEPIVIMDQAIGRVALKATSFPNAYRYHVLCNDAYIMLMLDQLTLLTNAKSFVKGVSKVIGEQHVSRA